MPPMIIPQFSANARKSNQFYLHELEKMLCSAPEKQNAPNPHILSWNSDLALEENGNRYVVSLQKSNDGKILSLNATLIREQVIYETRMDAILVRDNLFEITNLVFDNKAERIDCRYEIENVLNHIGRHMLAKACAGDIPVPHAEKGKFGKIGRFLHRCLPEDIGFVYLGC